MRLKPLLLVMVAAWLAAPAAATAAPTVGISENNWQMFQDPNFQSLGVTTTRLVTAYNVMDAAKKGDDELNSRVRPYLTAAALAGVEPLVTFEHARGAAEVCKTRRRPAQCRLPSADEYERNVAEFLLEFPQVRVIAPFNEANHFTQPTSRNPRAAARFTKIVEDLCDAMARDCKIVAVDLLDQADNPKAKRPTYRSTKAYIRKFKRAYGRRLALCGLHTYSDVNRFRSTGIRALMKALRCKRYWMTESGGLYDFGSFWSSRSTRRAGKCRSASACQLKATKYMFSLLRRYPRIDTVFVYTWFGGHTPRFDAGLVKGGPGEQTVPRRAYFEVARRI